MASEGWWSVDDHLHIIFPDKETAELTHEGLPDAQLELLVPREGYGTHEVNNDGERIRQALSHIRTRHLAEAIAVADKEPRFRGWWIAAGLGVISSALALYWAFM